MLRNKTSLLTKIAFACSLLVGLAFVGQANAAPANGGLTLTISVAGLPASQSSVVLTGSPHEIGSCGFQVTVPLNNGSGTVTCTSGVGQGIGGSPGGEGTNLVAPDTGGDTGTWSSTSAVGTPGAECASPEPSNQVCINMPSTGVGSGNVTVAQITVTYSAGQASTGGSSGLQCDKSGNPITPTEAQNNPGNVGSCTQQDPCACFGNNQPSYCTGSGTAQSGQSCQAVSGISSWLDAIINFVGVGVGLIITIMVVIGGIQYITSGGDPQGVAAAKKRITNALIALVAFAFMYAILQFIVPGGVF